jgi:alpha-beta hydrolase superfamily lysophospholipase
MGGAFALHYLQTNETHLTGLILLAPAVELKVTQFLRLSNIALLPSLFFCRAKPSVSLVDTRLIESTRDADLIVRWKRDPLTYKKVSINYLLGITKLTDNWKKALASGVNTPTLIIQGGKDPILSSKAPHILFEHLLVRDKELMIYRNVHHTLLWDPETPQILEDVAEWIIKHSKEKSNERNVEIVK